jgi:acyl dehydratase
MPFHVDEAVAKLTPMGGLFASSAHTISVGIKLSYSLSDHEIAAIAGLGWNDVRFPLPVMAGDTLRITSELVEKRESRSKPDRGIVVSQNRLYNQKDELVAEYKISTMMWRKPVNPNG